MRFIADRHEFISAVAKAARGIPEEHVQPQALTLFLRAQDGKLLLAGGANQIQTQVTLAVGVEREGSAVVMGRRFSDLVASLDALPDAQAVTVDFDAAKTVLTMTAKGARYDVRTRPDFCSPYAELKGDVTHLATVSGGYLREIVRRVGVVLSKLGSGINQIASGLLLECNGSTLTAVATDSVRIAILEVSAGVEDVQKITGKWKIIITRDALKAAVDAVGAEATVVLAQDDDGRIVFSGGSVVSRVRPLDSTFPNFRSILPKTQKSTVRVGRKLLQSAIRGVIPIATDKKYKVGLEAGDGTIVVTGTSPEYGDAERKIESFLDGVGMRLFFNGSYLLDFLDAADSDEVTIGVTSQSYPATCKPVQEDDGLTYIVMPITGGAAA